MNVYNYQMCPIQMFFSFFCPAGEKEYLCIYPIGLQWLAPKSVFDGVLDLDTSLRMLQQFREEHFHKTGLPAFPLKDEKLDQLEKIIFSSIKHGVYRIFTKYSKL